MRHAELPTLRPAARASVAGKAMERMRRGRRHPVTILVVDYDRDRTAGMTDVDMIEAISTTYGPPSKTPVKNTGAVISRVEADSGTPVARWGDADYSVVLYRGSYRSAFRLIVTSPRLEALTRTADAQAILLDEREAPQREIVRQKKEAEDARVAEEKARTVNKAAFRP